MTVCQLCWDVCAPVMLQKSLQSKEKNCNLQINKAEWPSLKYPQELRLCVSDLLFSILPSAPKAWPRGRELGLVPVSCGSGLCGGISSFPGEEPLDLSVPSSCLSFLLCGGCLLESSAVSGWGSGEMPHSGFFFPPFFPCY